MARGVVKFFKAERGWGAICCPELPDGQDVWIHYSDIEGTDYRAFEAGDVVDVDYEPARQDSFNFRATRARRLASGPAPTLRRSGNRVVIAPAGAPDTPRLERRSGTAGGTAADDVTLDGELDASPLLPACGTPSPAPCRTRGVGNGRTTGRFRA